MKSPAEQKIIQIDITNACNHQCSNCTRFCGHHEKPFMMDFETFKQAVDSLVDFPGMVGIMGGEPTLHPEFERFVEYYASKIGPSTRSPRGCAPIVDFSEYRTRELSEVKGRRGLWTSLGRGYYKHFELIQEVFDYQCINDHVNPGLHQALLVSRKELGIADNEWVKLRDNCWIQNLWSSGVTPKGAFFCEVAGALDTLFDGPGGWPLDEKWWLRRPKDFGEQLQWCEMCGAALQVPRRQANEEVDDLSPELYEKLKGRNSPKVLKQRVEVLNLEQYEAGRYGCEPTMEWYLPDGNNRQRIDGTNQSLYPKKLLGVVLSDETDGEVAPELARHFDRLEVLSAKDSLALIQQLQATDAFDWVVVMESGLQLDENFGRDVRQWVLNPGCFYYQSENPAGALAIEHKGRATGSILRNNRFVLFNMRARALRSCGNGSELEQAWDKHKRIDLQLWNAALGRRSEYEIEGELLARHMVSLWQAVSAISSSIYLYGSGEHTKWLLKLIRNHELPEPTGIFDDSGTGRAEEGIPVITPDSVKQPGAVVLSANTRRVSRILRQRCQAVWGDSVAVVDPYDGFEDKAFRKTVLKP